MNIPSIGLQDDIGTIDILSKVMQAAIAGISIYIVRYSTIIWRSATTMATKAQSSLSLPSLASRNTRTRSAKNAKKERKPEEK